MTTSTSNPVAPPDPAERPATFRAVLGVPEFRALFGSFAVFMVGETVKMLALAVLVYDRTGSSLLSALAYVVGFLPHALGGVLLLALADRWRPRALLVGYDLVRLVAVAVLALGVLPPLAMVALVFVVGLFAPVSTAVRNALLPDLLGGDAYVLGRSMFTVAAGATQVLGFAAGGLLLGLVGPYGALWLTAATCAITAIMIRWGVADRPRRVASADRPAAAAADHSAAAAPADGVPADHPGGAPVDGVPADHPGGAPVDGVPADQAGGGAPAAGTTGPVPAGGRTGAARRQPGVIRETWQVNRMLLADRRIRNLLLAHWLPAGALVGAEGVIVPYTSGLGPGASAGVLFAASALGMLTGDLVLGRLVAPARRERLARWLAVLLGAPMLVFVAGPGLAVAVALFAAASFGYAYHLGLARRFLAVVPQERRGQAFGLLTTGAMAGQGLAAGAAGALAEGLAPNLVMALAGGVSLLATGLLWRHLTVPDEPREHTSPNEP